MSEPSPPTFDTFTLAYDLFFSTLTTTPKLFPLGDRRLACVRTGLYLRAQFHNLRIRTRCVRGELYVALRPESTPIVRPLCNPNSPLRDGTG